MRAVIRFGIVSLLVVSAGGAAQADVSNDSDQTVDDHAALAWSYLQEAPIYAKLSWRNLPRVVEKIWSETQGKQDLSAALEPLRRALGIDGSPLALERLGLEKGKPIFATLLRYHKKELRRVHAHVAGMLSGRALKSRRWKREMAGLSAQDAKDRYLQSAPVSFVQSRILFPLANASLFKQAVRRLGRGAIVEVPGRRGERETSLAPLGKRLVRALRLDEDAAKRLGKYLAQEQVWAVIPVGRRPVALWAIRFDAGFAVVDFLFDWKGQRNANGPPPSVHALRKALKLPKKGNVEKAARVALVRDTDGELWINTKQLVGFLEMWAARTRLWRAVLYAGATGADPAFLKKERRLASECRKAWGSELGDRLQISLKLGKGDWKAKFKWGLHRKIAALLAGSRLDTEVVDPTAGDDLLLVGSKIDLMKLSGALRRGIFTKAKSFAKSLRKCRPLSQAALFAGGGIKAIGPILDILTKNKTTAPIAQGLRGAALTVTSLGRTAESVGGLGTGVFHAIVAEGAAVKLRGQIQSLAKRPYPPPRTRTYNGRSTTVYGNLTGPMRKLVVGITELPQGQIAFTFGTRVWDVFRYLRRRVPKNALLPPRVLAYGYGKLGEIFRAMRHGKKQALRPLSVGKRLLRFNISLMKTDLSAELTLETR